MAQGNIQVAGIVERVLLRNPITSFFDNIVAKVPLFSDLSNHFGSIFLKSISTSWQKLLVLAGATTLTIGGYRFLKRLTVILSILVQHKISQAKSSAKLFKQKYGDCWVAITGFTEGIGWAFVNELLRLNMKLVLIGRNKEKIDKRVNFLREKFPQCQLQVIVGDLSKVSDIMNICKDLKELSQKIDIGILINNAGLAGTGELIKNTPQSILDILQTNWTSVVLLNNAMVPIMRSRKARSAIINFSSSTGSFICPLLSSYPASKRMINVYSEFLRKQNADKIDVMTVMPFGVITPMMRMIKDPAMITPQNCAKSVISDLIGGNLYTYGGLPHKFFANIFQNLSEEQGAKRLEAFWKKHA